MSIKKLILQLEKFFKQKFHDLDAGFYVSKRNMCVHMGLEKSIFSYSNYKEKLKNEINFSKNTCQINSLLLSCSSYIQPSGNSTT